MSRFATDHPTASSRGLGYSTGRFAAHAASPPDMPSKIAVTVSKPARRCIDCTSLPSINRKDRRFGRARIRLDVAHASSHRATRSRGGRDSGSGRVR